MSEGSSGRGVAGAACKGRNLVKIPVDLYNECRANARAEEADAANRVDPSTIEICPYRRGHRVSAHKMSAHLQKCRINYVTKMAARGYKRVRMTCKYNIRHQVLPPEKLYHEARCDDRHYVPFYLLYVNPYFEGEKFKANLEECKTIDPVELAKMHEGLFLDSVIGGDNPTLLPVPVDDILHPEAAEQRKFLKRKEEEEEARVKQSQSDSHTGAEGEHQEAEGAAGGSDSNQGPEMDEEERWWNECTAPKFNYTDSMNHPRGPLGYKKYPPGLTRAGRREFDKWNTEWMAKILAEDRRLYPLEYATEYDEGLDLSFFDALYLDERTGPGAVDHTSSEADGFDFATAATSANSNAAHDADATRGTSEGTVPVAYTGGRRRVQKWVEK